MKKNFFIFSILIAGFLMLPAFCFGAVEYSRNPSGYAIQNPVSFDISFNDFEIDTGCAVIYNYWGIVANILDEGEDWFSDEFYASTTQSQIITGTLPLNEYSQVSFTCSIQGTQVDNVTETLEGTGHYAIFEVVSGAVLFSLPEEAVASTTGIMSDLINDIFVFIALAIGIPLGFYVVKKWLAFMPK